MLLKPLEDIEKTGRTPHKPIIAITIGDVAGIGPEIVCKALLDRRIYAICRPVVIGDRRVIEREIVRNELNLSIESVSSPEEARFKPGTMALIDLANAEGHDLEMGKVSSLCGRAAYEYIAKSVELALSSKVSAVATAPINKLSLKAADISYTGHTEIFAAFTRTDDPITMFEIPGEMRVFFLSRHVSLLKACELIKKKRVFEYIRKCSRLLKAIGCQESGPLGVAALNPHCGEGGLFGTEELDEIIPAIEEAKKLGIAVEGPIGADSIFALARKGVFSAVLSMYHDQGHIATKTLSFEGTVSVTLGMPFLRTSVDHGTAFDIAGTGTASPVSMVEAIKLAALYSRDIHPTNPNYIY